MKSQIKLKCCLLVSDYLIGSYTKQNPYPSVPFACDAFIEYVTNFKRNVKLFSLFSMVSKQNLNSFYKIDEQIKHFIFHGVKCCCFRVVATLIRICVVVNLIVCCLSSHNTCIYHFVWRPLWIFEASCHAFTFRFRWAH